jgi:peptidoglycan/xylan/chitin deacetylase (PgdA/CDA1 family)
MAVVVTIDVEFGDRPTPDPLGTLDELVRILDDHGAPATFFVQGRWAKAHPALAADLAARDVTLGLHGYTHVDYRRLSDAGVRAELADGLAALRAAAPDHTVRYTRLPHGYGTDEPRILAALEEAELIPVGWDYSTFDWDEDLPLERRAGRAARALEQGGVVLMHSWPAQTPRILAQLLGAAGPGDIVSLDDVELPGCQSTGRTMHVERTDPPR